MSRLRNIEFFFTLPTVEPVTHARMHRDGKLSVLYLLRRDIQDCLLPDSANKIIPENQVITRSEYKRHFPTAILIMIGIDLLSKFHAGDDDDLIGRRYKDFLKKYSNITEGEADAVWGVRNSLSHSFGLYDFRRRRKGTTRRSPARYFNIVPECFRCHDEIIPIHRWNNGWDTCIKCLYETFRYIIEEYHQDVSSDANLGKNFTRMFRKYGTLYIGPVERTEDETGLDARRS